MRIEIKPATIERIEKELGGKITDRVINKGIDAVTGSKPRRNTKRSKSVDLTHADITKAVINAVEVKKQWNYVLRYLVFLASKNERNIKSLGEIFPSINIKEEYKEDEGYQPLSKTIGSTARNISVQGVRTSKVYEAIDKAARILGFTIVIDYKYNKDSPTPGKTGTIKIP